MNESEERLAEDMVSRQAGRAMWEVNGGRYEGHCMFYTSHAFFNVAATTPLLWTSIFCKTTISDHAHADHFQLI